MYSAYKRIISFFPTPTWRRRASRGRTNSSCSSRSATSSPTTVFGDPYMPPVSDGSGSDRKLLKHAYDFCSRPAASATARRLKLPNGKPLTIEFLDSSSALAAAYPAVHPEFAQARHPGATSASSTRRSIRAAPTISISTSSPTALGGSLDAGRRSARSSSPRQAAARTDRAISPASPTRPSMRFSRRSPRRNRAKSSTRPAARSTGCCAPAIIGCRCGIATPHGRLLGRLFAARAPAEISASARRASGGGTQKRPSDRLVISALAAPPRRTRLTSACSPISPAACS